MIKPLSLILLSLATLTTQAATYYKWTDSNGIPHYSQYAPTNGVDLKKVQVINNRELGPATSATASGANGSAPPTSSTMTPEQKRIAELEAEKKAQQKQQDKEHCKSLQNNLANLNIGGRLYEMDNKGERKYLDGREIELRRQKVAQAISQYCK
ncbi:MULTISPECIES: DUF4124 domain-containing protein [unclassified Moraxella]|uniref:DUF4124 domain-containing protein n=1 Tax=unclassified Moraxella TaxID=2685852 RepID=UPI003AF91138